MTVARKNKPKRRQQLVVNFTPARCQTPSCDTETDRTFCDECWAARGERPPQNKAEADAARVRYVTHGERDRRVKFDPKERGPW